MAPHLHLAGEIFCRMHGHAQMGGLKEGVGWPERITGNGRFFCRWQGVAFVVPGGPADPGIKGRKGGGRGWFFRRSRAGLVGRDEEGKQNCEEDGKWNQFEFHRGSIGEIPAANPGVRNRLVIV